ncbi:MAG: acetolactate synthase, large subunit, biosynthetic type [SAR324 cluster bacterium]|uniref:Acetolactate synthase n=1 Tax=SAR324 cluster bacterium TaxID=2024889 RepID=A0A2A4T888_9DELT|nr:MAG: acetolactate synthase, large subunit, biosynthetic type [SAR324 cluster bacterium]
MKRKGTEIILQALINEGVKTVFGYPGGCVIPLFDEFLNYDEIELVRVRHEQAATHAADGYARVSGKASVVIATSGPGATNTITGIATAAMDSIPMVIITGQVRTAVIGTNAFQETNVVGVSRPVTKHNYLVKTVDSLPRILKEAFHIAQTGRPGPVLVDIPVDLQTQFTEEPFPSEVKIPGYVLPPEIGTKDIQQAWEMIRHSYKPVLYVGGGAILADAAAELIKFVEKTNIPVVTTLLGLGAFPEGHELSLGMLGMHGHYTANMSMTKTDLVLAIGARFDDRVTGKVESFLAQSKIIHVDVDASVINKIKEAHLGIVGDVKEFLQKLNQVAEPLSLTPWLDELTTMQKEHPLPNYDQQEMEENCLRPEYVIRQFCQETDGKAVIVTDVGQHQMFVALHYQFKEARSHLSSGGLGTMGFSLPAAMGVAFYNQKRPIISFSGDGGFQMNIQELATVHDYNMPLIIVVLNNGNLGMVKQWQDLFWEGRHASTIFETSPDFVKIAEAYGIPAYRTGLKEEVPLLVKKALQHKGPILLEFMLEKDAMVYPMIPAGGELTDIIEGEG